MLYRNAVGALQGASRSSRRPGTSVKCLLSDRVGATLLIVAALPALRETGAKEEAAGGAGGFAVIRGK